MVSDDTSLMARKQVKKRTEPKAELSPIRWSRRTALDPKHRPQVPDRPSTTVRREWARAPQEAHVLDSSQERIRRLTVCEIAAIQTFESDWIEDSGVSGSDAIKAL